MTIGKRIRIMRIDLNMTQSELAEKIGVTNKIVSMWETGKRDIAFADLSKAASCFGVSVAQLVEGTEPKDPNAQQADENVLPSRHVWHVKEKHTEFVVTDELRAEVAAAPEGQRIYVLRKGLGLSQKVFGERIGMTNTVISKYEHENRMPSDRVRSLIANAFDVQIAPEKDKPEKPFDEIKENEPPEMTPEEKNIINAAVAQRIQRLRKEKGLTQKALAEKIGVSHLTISIWEQGYRQVSPSNMEKLAEALGVDVEWIKNGIQPSEGNAEVITLAPAEPTVSHTCVICGKLIPKGLRRRRYCSKACMKEANRRRIVADHEARQEKRSSVYITRKCTDCGVEFVGHIKSFRCPECSQRAKREHARVYRESKKAGKVRTIGSIDKCARCGKDYIVNSGLQRYCPTCAPIACRQNDSEASKAWYKTAYADDAKRAERYERKRVATPLMRICPVCLKTFSPATGQQVCCSYECKSQWNKEKREEREKSKRK